LIGKRHFWYFVEYIVIFIKNWFTDRNRGIHVLNINRKREDGVVGALRTIAAHYSLFKVCSNTTKNQYVRSYNCSNGFEKSRTICNLIYGKNCYLSFSQEPAPMPAMELSDILPDRYSYDKMRPPKRNGLPTVVYNHFTVMGLDSIDENSMVCYIHSLPLAYWSKIRIDFR